jgi:hypothetical protein
VLNQFALSEDKGYLRVATTDTGPTGVPGPGSESFVTVLKNSGELLTQVGQVGGLGKGQAIQAVRFIGDVGYVVTFLKTDPLYTVDLSQPTRPRVVGALELQGYSAYLHPLGPGLLLGVGQDATDQGRRAGTEVSVFDVSHPATPKLLQHHPFGQGASSPIEFDHHAFMYWPATRLAVIPYSQYNEPSDGQPATLFRGAVGLIVGADAIGEVGQIRQPVQGNENGSPGYLPPIDRSVVVGDQLLTTSYVGVLGSDLHSLAERTWVPFS